MMKNQTKEQTIRRIYAAPVCEEVPVWTEGTLCGSGDPKNGTGNAMEDLITTIGQW